MVAKLQLEAMQPEVIGMVLGHLVPSFYSFPAWYWLNTEKYALLDKLKAIKSIPYTEQETQNSWAGSRNWKLHKLPCGKELHQLTMSGNTAVMCILGGCGRGSTKKKTLR